MIAAIKKQVFRGEGREMVPHGEAGQAGRRISSSVEFTALEKEEFKAGATCEDLKFL